MLLVSLIFFLHINIIHVFFVTYFVQWKTMALIFMPFILNGIIEEATTISSDEKQDIIFLGVTLCQICQLLCERVLSLHALDIANELIILYCTVFEKVFPGQSTPNMVYIYIF